MLVFEERGNRSTRRKPLGAEQRTNKQSYESVYCTRVMYRLHPPSRIYELKVRIVNSTSGHGARASY